MALSSLSADDRAVHFIFPINSMPRALQIITHLVPARYFLVALAYRVKGTALDNLLPQLGALTIYAAAMLSMASVRLARERG